MTEEHSYSSADLPRAPVAHAASGKDEHWERDVLAKVAMAAVTEQRRARRWGIFFKLFFIVYLLLLLMMVWPDGDSAMNVGKSHTAIIEIKGVIADDGDASADNVVKALRGAFDDKHTQGIILRINSPGGSPVQAGYISDEIKRLRGKHPDMPVYAVVTDMCASGGYYVAAAADEIYADKASMVGSIGVVMASFGFTEALEKLGVERRLLTAGEHKGLLDPFSPVKDEEVAHLRVMLENIHQQFIDTVKAGRGGRLKDDPDIFSGLIWTGEQSVEMGLVDGLGSASYVARELIGEERMVDFTYRPDPVQRLFEQLGVGAAQGFINALRGAQAFE